MPVHTARIIMNGAINGFTNLYLYCRCVPAFSIMGPRFSEENSFRCLLNCEKPLSITSASSSFDIRGIGTCTSERSNRERRDQEWRQRQETAWQRKNDGA